MLEHWDFEAANDHCFRPPRHRTLPIPQSVTPVDGYPSKLRIYLTNASPFWQVKVYLAGKSHTRSLRTTSKALALRAARDFYHVKTAELYADRVTPRGVAVTFSDLVPAVLAEERARVQRGEFSSDGLRILQNRLTKNVEPMLGSIAVNRIGHADILKLVQSMSSQGMSSTTIQQHLVATRKVLKHALMLAHISNLPSFPSVKITSKPRGSFTVAEYLALVRTARRLIGTRIPVESTDRSRRGADKLERYAQISPDLHWLIVFMVNGFMRPSDIKNLQHQHITKVRGQNIYLRLNLPESKLHDKPIVTLQPAVRVYERLCIHQAAIGMGKPTDYVFMPEMADRKRALEFLGYQFRYVLVAAGLGVNVANNQQRTLYSLRHTALMFRLLYGDKIDLLTLARNARTSVEMIERFYASALTGEMNVAMLQSRRTVQNLNK